LSAENIALASVPETNENNGIVVPLEAACQTIRGGSLAGIWQSVSAPASHPLRQV